MKFTRENLVQIWGVLNGLTAEKTTAKGAYGIAKNKRIVDSEVKSIEEAQKNQKLPDGIEEFESKRIELCKKMADKDEEGNPMVANNSFVLVQNKQKFDKKLEKLRKDYDEPISLREKQDKEFQDFLKEEVEIDFHTINVNDLPDNVTAQQIGILDEIIVD